MTFSEIDQPLDFNILPAYGDDTVDRAPEAWELIDSAPDDSPVDQFVALAELSDVLHSYVSQSFVAHC